MKDNKIINVCVIGGGNITNTRHIPALRKLKDVNIVGVISDVQGKLDSTCKKNNIEHGLLVNDPKNESILIDDKKVNYGFHNNGGVRDSFSGGEFTYRDLIKVVPFDNTVCVAKLSLNQFDVWLDSNEHYEYSGIVQEGDYVYIAAINYLSDNVVSFPSVESKDTNVVIQDVLKEYLKAHDDEL